MASYFFNLATPNRTIWDPQGVDLPNETAAREHAHIVADELLRQCEPVRRSWRLDVCGSDQRLCFSVLFATIDSSIDHLSPELRSSFERLHANAASLSEAIRAVRLSLLQVKGALARAEGAPYLAAIGGTAVNS